MEYVHVHVYTLYTSQLIMHLHNNQLVLILNYFSLQLAFSYTRMQLLPTLMSAIQHTGSEEVTKQLREGRSVVNHLYDFHTLIFFHLRTVIEPWFQCPQAFCCTFKYGYVSLHLLQVWHTSHNWSLHP